VVLADKQRYPPWCLAYTDGTTIFACPSARAEPKAFGMALDELVDYLDGVMAPHPMGRYVLALGADSDLESERKSGLTVVTSDSAAAAAGKEDVNDSTTREQPPALPSVNPTAERMLEYRKTLIPLALVLLLSNPDLLGKAGHGIDTQNISKKDISDMLHQLVSLWPDGNPPRAALKRVNEYLMSPYA
jgi:tRNA A64-2'-O-ribosylphosphate transferase